MNTPTFALTLPLLGMLTLTMVVWCLLFVKRMSYISANKIKAQDMKTPEQVQQLIPGEVAAPGNNLKNLFELPVVFYAICLYLVVAVQVDDIHYYCAWIFLVFRIIHSIIHCTYNQVMHRFAAYVISSIALWVMVVRALVGAM
ncbi:MAG: MAPEG family protein [Halioglobus sp.]